MQKTIAIYFSDSEPMGYPFHKKEYFEKYAELTQRVKDAGINIYIVRADSYLGDGIFSRGWEIVGDGVTEIDKQVKADLIFNRDDKNTIPHIADCKVINHPDFDALCLDKLKTAKAFPNLSPQTDVVHSYKDATEILSSWNLSEEDLVVLKKNYETEGRGIFILPLREIEESLYEDWSNVLLQEFVDGSCGVPNLAEGLHDLRVTVINGEPINSFMRIPKVGSYLANVARGGSGSSVDLAHIPKEVIDLVYEIDESVKQYFPAIYAADFMNSPKGYKLIELNSRPGMQHPNWSKTYDVFNEGAARMLIDAVLNT